MKTLYIIRHAKSDWDNPFLNDFDRPLNKRGEKSAPFMGNVLAKTHIYPDLILGHSIQNIPTCGIVCVTLKEDDWNSIGENSTQFVSFDYPKKHKEY